MSVRTSIRISSGGFSARRCALQTGSICFIGPCHQSIRNNSSIPPHIPGSGQSTQPPPPHSSPGPSSSSNNSPRLTTAQRIFAELDRTPPTVGASGKKYPQIKVIYVFFGLTGLGLFLAIYGGLEFYLALPKWPENIRTPLRQALKARNDNDTKRAEGFFRE